jgi:fumarate reductase subunit C
MSQAPRPARYTDYHPRWYRSRVSTWWWMGRWSYLRFILREISSVFVAWFILVLLLMIQALSRGRAAYAGFEAWLRNPIVVLLNAISLFFVLFHAITWFNLAPAAMVVRLGGKRVPGALIAGSNYLAWAVVTAIIVWFLVKQ